MNFAKIDTVKLVKLVKSELFILILKEHLPKHLKKKFDEALVKKITHAQFLRINKDHIKKYTAQLEKRFNEIGREVLGNIKKTPKSFDRWNEARRQAEAMKTLIKTWKAWVEADETERSAVMPEALLYAKFDVDQWLFSRQKWRGIFTTDGKLYTAAPLKDGGVMVLDDLPVEMSFDHTDPRAIKWVAENAKNAGWSITQTQYDRLKVVLMDSLADGLSIPKIRDKIEEAMEVAAKRAEQIARTEVLKASNRGVLIGMKQSGVVEGRQWLATMDNRTCFLAKTKVMTDKGERNIEDIKIGEIVLTHLGWNRVKNTYKREYNKPLTEIKMSNERTLRATPDHPVFEMNRGWVDAGDLLAGSKLQACENKMVYVRAINNIGLLEANYLITKGKKFSVFNGIFLNIRVPIFTVNFKTKIKMWNKKINTISRNLIFLNEINFKKLKRFAYRLFKRCFSRVFTITRKRTKTSDPFFARANAKPFFALKTLNIDRRTPTFFRTIFNIFSFYSKYFSAPLTFSIERKFCFAFSTTDDISMRNVFINRKLLIAYRAHFYNFFPFLMSGHVASTRTIFPWTASIRINYFSTLFTNAFFPSDSRLMIAIRRTINRFKRSRRKLFSAIFARMHHYARYCTSKVKRSKPLFVYNLEVDKAKTYFAEGILVHNCTGCAEMDGTTMALDKPFFKKGSSTMLGGIHFAFDYEEIQHPPLHVSCRCTLLAILKQV